jgi:hypothetical protein
MNRRVWLGERVVEAAEQSSDDWRRVSGTESRAREIWRILVGDRSSLVAFEQSLLRVTLRDGGVCALVLIGLRTLKGRLVVG